MIVYFHLSLILMSHFVKLHRGEEVARQQNLENILLFVRVNSENGLSTKMANGPHHTRDKLFISRSTQRMRKYLVCESSELDKVDKGREGERRDGPKRSEFVVTWKSLITRPEKGSILLQMSVDYCDRKIDG